MPDHPKIARTDHEVLEVIRHRWSPRAFDSTRDLDVDDLRRLFEAARWAPSSRNEQPWRFVVASRTRSAAAFAALLASLNPTNQAWAAAAPVLVLAVVRLRHERDELENAHAWYDAGQAVAYRKYSRRYVPVEEAARAAGVGVWSTEFDMPWSYRQRH